MVQTIKERSLYEEDILLWVEDTLAKLKAKDFENLDLEHLMEEVESLGISQRKEFVSRLIVILEHLLKRLYVESPLDYNGWERTIRTQRNDLQVLLNRVPSLKSCWEASFQEAWELALKTVRKEYKTVEFPNDWSFSRSLSDIIDQEFWIDE